jgi:phage terminase large subunit
VKEWLKPIETRDEQTGEKKVTSRLKIFTNCENLIRCLPQVQKSEKDPNDVSPDPHELTHAPDSIRTFCSSRPAPSDPLSQSRYEDEDEDEDDISASGYNSFYD